MLISYIRRYGWRQTSTAFVNFLLWFAVFVQLSGLAAMGASRSVYSQISSDMGFDDGTLMGSVLVNTLLGEAGFWVLAIAALAVLVKEFVGITLRRRLMINALLLLGSSGLLAYVVSMLHLIPLA